MKDGQVFVPNAISGCRNDSYGSRKCFCGLVYLMGWFKPLAAQEEMRK